MAGLHLLQNGPAWVITKMLTKRLKERVEPGIPTVTSPLTIDTRFLGIPRFLR